jgi:MtN3 and saliva related transmembrane protein
MSIETIGFIAGILTSISLLPQVIKALKTHSTHDLSYMWMAINGSGQILWIAYGVAINSTPLFIASVITFAMVVILFTQKLKFDAKIKLEKNK